MASTSEPSLPWIASARAIDQACSMQRWLNHLDLDLVVPLAALVALGLGVVTAEVRNRLQ